MCTQKELSITAELFLLFLSRSRYIHTFLDDLYLPLNCNAITFSPLPAHRATVIMRFYLSLVLYLLDCENFQMYKRHFKK